MAWDFCIEIPAYAAAAAVTVYTIVPKNPWKEPLEFHDWQCDTIDSRHALHTQSSLWHTRCILLWQNRHSTNVGGTTTYLNTTRCILLWQNWHPTVWGALKHIWHFVNIKISTFTMDFVNTSKHIWHFVNTFFIQYFIQYFIHISYFILYFLRHL